MEQLDRLVDLTAADVICLQETKCAETPSFLRDAIGGLGYPHQAYRHGKTAESALQTASPSYRGFRFPTSSAIIRIAGVTDASPHQRAT